MLAPRSAQTDGADESTSPQAGISHDGLWVFANRIFANWIFANGVLADWRRRHRGGSLRGRSAAAASLSMATSPAVTIMIVFMMLIPLCCSSGTGRPNDAPI